MTYIDSDGVESLAGVWGRAAEGLRAQGDKVRSCELRAETFGSHYADQMADIGPAVERLAGLITSDGARCDDYRDKLRLTSTAFIATDDRTASGLGGDPSRQG
ncbi:hypothetical protein BKG83_05500 [Mycobacteroides chelonae]|jgi:hypothetical protein|uniref:ESX-1 secretion-associated protein n=1 Tax=Mycobacteroides chelonae TaxID=1774 RepID=A0A1S1M5R9_MYCCH|nr:hypothetical protein [Mycobacteroides chelonae]PKQ59394.1 hypothetical protein B5566_03635 [Mycobacterium sp. MHSD3]SKL32474.1 Uncharacterised protein [Mycobacteroides abscessus subsp. bolletii]MBF9318044.1 hypothetical protein [Mycobacteroides chelonae]MBF9524051.1 hypothetical protein [Mycobacteroides chelonae]OHT72212.1 hypothetical protein BKG67_10060 [Mycobacteroides chelonae]